MSARTSTLAATVLMATALTIVGLLAGFSDAVQEQPSLTEKSSRSADSKPVEADATPKELLSGKVVFLQEALKRRGVKAADEFQAQAVLETDSGELIPLVPDWRGRAFFQDERLRGRRVDLVGSRQKATPYLQVQMVFVFDEKGTRQYMDYWCDICSIAMYELKPCDCCQEEIRLRFQPQELPEFVKKKK